MYMQIFRTHTSNLAFRDITTSMKRGKVLWVSYLRYISLPSFPEWHCCLIRAVHTVHGIVSWDIFAYVKSASLSITIEFRYRKRIFVLPEDCAVIPNTLMLNLSIDLHPFLLYVYFPEKFAQLQQYWNLLARSSLYSSSFWQASHTVVKA